MIISKDKNLVEIKVKGCLNIQKTEKPQTAISVENNGNVFYIGQTVYDKQHNPFKITSIGTNCSRDLILRHTITNLLVESEQNRLKNFNSETLYIVK